MVPPLEPGPDTMVSPETGETLKRDVRPFRVTYKGESLTVDLPGYYPVGEGDGVHVGSDLNSVDEALRAIKQRVDPVRTRTRSGVSTR